MPKTLLQVRDNTRRFLKDQTESIWTNNDIDEFINQALRIIKGKLPLYFTDLVPVVAKTDVVQLRDELIDLPAMFAASRCFAQDEQHYRATSTMNEFESRLQEGIDLILDSKEYQDILDQAGENQMDYVVDAYFYDKSEF